MSIIKMNWKIIPDYPNYKIYTDGTIYNIKTNKEFKGSISSSGYKLVTLSDGLISKKKLIHYLLAKCFIENPDNKPIVDHIDRNKLNNDLSNLRWSTPSQNNSNKKKRDNMTSKYKGVLLTKNGAWWSSFRFNNKKYYLGTYDTEIQAAKAYDKKAKELNPEFAWTNFIDDVENPDLIENIAPTSKNKRQKIVDDTFAIISGYPNYKINKEGIILNIKTNKYLFCNVSNYKRVSLINNNGRYRELIHRLLALTFIPNPDNKPIVDHIDRNKLNNDLSNLRWCSQIENSHNRHKRNNTTSKYKGVSLNKHGTWGSSSRFNNIYCYLGTYDTEIQAAKAYDKKVKELNPEFAWTNFIDDVENPDLIENIAPTSKNKRQKIVDDTFAFIPGYPNYKINKEGIILNIKTNKYLFSNVSNYKNVSLSNNNGRYRELIHRLLALTFIPNPDNKPIVDHIDQNKLNNDLSNLRWCRQIENNYNRHKRNNISSKYKGVGWHKQNKKWMASIHKDNKNIHLGCFDDEVMAAKKYNEKAIELFGEFASLNQF